MLGEACREREMPDCEFFLNKRDYPQLKVNVPRGVPGEFLRGRVRILYERLSRERLHSQTLLTAENSGALRLHL